MRRQFAMMTVGVTAGLLALAPVASANEGHDKPEADGGTTCTYTAGDASAVADISGDTGMNNAVSQAPVAGSNIGNLCGNEIVLVDASQDAPQEPTR